MTYPSMSSSPAYTGPWADSAGGWQPCAWQGIGIKQTSLKSPLTILQLYDECEITSGTKEFMLTFSSISSHLLCSAFLNKYLTFCCKHWNVKFWDYSCSLPFKLIPQTLKKGILIQLTSHLTNTKEDETEIYLSISLSNILTLHIQEG